MAPLLGNHFSEPIREELATRNLKIKGVIKVYCSFARKEKRFIIIGEKYDHSGFALLYINSEINENMFPSEEQKNEHVLISQEGRSYLSKDSYVNCTQMVYKDRGDLMDLLVNHPEAHLGEFSDNDYKLVRDKVCDSKIITAGKKKEYGVFLK
ncbi:MAG: hypothetical protein JNL13_07835 [Chitinophagaceae bacterium]|nr:hypothetical protein [Chitinophagaceae bacterium]